MYRWASISKTLVGLVAAHLAHTSVVDLDADIHEYYTVYPDPTQYLQCADGTPAAARYPGNGGHPNRDCLQKIALPPHHNITLRLLLSHRAGMPHYHNGETNPKPPDVEANNPRINTGMSWALEKYLSPLALVAVPGSIYSYSTFGFNLAAETLARAANQSFVTLVTNRHSVGRCICSCRPSPGPSPSLSPSLSPTALALDLALASALALDLALASALPLALALAPALTLAPAA